MSQYIDNDGKTHRRNPLTDYTRRNILSQYTTLSDFLAAWNNASFGSKLILDALEEQGVLMEEVAGTNFKEVLTHV